MSSYTTQKSRYNIHYQQDELLSILHWQQKKKEADTIETIL
jgi:hypothetical protein